ncbi:MAG: hypothetical protein ACYTFI_00915 [Planctomycetota bacterium]
MKERGIIFQGWGVRAIRNMKPGVWPAEAIDPALPIKWQTRRVVKWKPYEPTTNLRFGGLTLGHYCTGVPESGWVLRSRGGNSCWNDRTHPAHCPYGVPGDGLWVRETFQPILEDGLDSWEGTDWKTGQGYRIRYPATDPVEEYVDLRTDSLTSACKPSIHMPRWASREDLVVKEVRVERAQEITLEDCHAEGFPERFVPEYGQPGGAFMGMVDAAKWDFGLAWEDINGKRGFGWEANPWVWVVSYMRKAK